MVLGRYVAQIPMAALVAVMIVVSVDTFQWRSIRTLVTHPTTSSIVMLGTVAVVLATHDLAKGVLFGVVLSGCSSPTRSPGSSPSPRRVKAEPAPIG